MGQYQQWLHYQEVDRRLRAELEALETELAQLKEVVCLTEAAFEQLPPQKENVLIRILAAGLNGLAVSPAELHFSPSQHDSSSEDLADPAAYSTLDSVTPQQARSADTEPRRGEGGGEERGEPLWSPVAPALMGWGGLPNFGPQETFVAPLPAIEQAIPPTSHPEIALLPEDMLAFFDEHSPTDPQLERPWWLRTMMIAASASNTKGTADPIDQERLRTNHLVQRWIERWRRQIPSQIQAGLPVPRTEFHQDHPDGNERLQQEQEARDE